ncbi:MAG TPA: DUF5681 domain-containing protein [Chitinophagales bacterium]|nr:DUF5681 domain-containing protein [Chitinophagales bacterium]
MAREDNLKKRKPFTKNDPRINREGRPKKLPALDVIIAEVLGSDSDTDSPAKAIIQALHKRAVKGDVRAAELLLERAYGKTKQQIEVTNKKIKVTRT